MNRQHISRARICDEPAQKSQKLEKLVGNNNPRPDAASSCTSEQQVVVETVRCACCCVAEDCTAAYIRGVRASLCGDWLCGLCAEAVKETVRRDPAGDVAAALVSHEEECRDFNTTTRLNPTLSLAGSMRRIARRSFDRRAASCQERRSGEAALARSASCDPWFRADLPGTGADDRASSGRWMLM